MSALLDAALRCAAADWPVFPCRPNNKTPLGWLAPNGVKNATVDPDVIRRWWRRCPVANVAVATGAPGPDVVDFDTKAGAPGHASFIKLRDAGLLRGASGLVTTPSGGFHLYYAGSEQGNGATRHGVDFRGRGGYVLAPPSYVADDEHGYADHYRLAEHRGTTGAAGVDWRAIRRFLDPPRPEPSVRPGRRGDHGALVRWVAGRAEGNRNESLFWAACRALETGAGRAVLSELVAAGVSAGLVEHEARRTVESAGRRAGGTA